MDFAKIAVFVVTMTVILAIASSCQQYQRGLNEMAVECVKAGNQMINNQCVNSDKTVLP
jgi:hypothetical protein